MSFPVTVRLSVRRSVAPRPDFSAADLFRAPEKETLEIFSEGRVSVRSGSLHVVWQDADGRENSIIFPKEDPGLVTFKRSFPGAGEIVYVFEKGVRHISISSLGGENIDLITGCTELENTLIGNGRLRIRYFIEIHGFRCETSEIRLAVRRIKTEREE